MKFYLLLLVVVALQRLYELKRSQANWRHHQQRAQRLPEPVYKWMVLLHVSLFILPPFELWWRQTEFGGWLSWSALLVFCTAQGLRFWVLMVMGRQWNVRLVHGPDYAIVTSGPYRWVRHPNYTAVVLELLCLPLIYKLYFSSVLLSLGNTVVLWWRIKTEEHMLSQNPAWRQMMAHKPRFIPGLW